jgi:hypothetical protein
LFEFPHIVATTGGAAAVGWDALVDTINS